MRAGTAVHVVLRTTAKVNSKPRPPGLDKLACLVSLLQAVEQARAHGVPVELVHVCDGSPGGVHEALLTGSGEMVRGTFDLQASYATAVELAGRRGWPDDDLVYLAEDDHLHRPEALSALAAAGERLPGTGSFVLYGSVDAVQPNGLPLPPALAAPPGWRASTTSTVVEGVVWRRALSATSSMVHRAGALRQDRLIHVLALRGRGIEGTQDQVVCLAIQGLVPFAWGRPLGHLVTGQEPLERRVKHGVWDVVLNVLALRARRHPREILGSVPALATHAELGWLASGTDWTAVGEQARAWAAGRGLLPPNG